MPAKHEFILHYPELTLHFGPLKHLRTLRCEGKHKFFKDAINHFKNFKNPTKTLSTLHQQSQCLDETSYECRAIPIKAIKYSTNDYDDKTAGKINDFIQSQNIQNIYICEKAEFRGVTYAKNMPICMGKSLYGNFIICTIHLF